MVLSAHASLHGAYLSHCDNGEFGRVIVGRCTENGEERERIEEKECSGPEEKGEMRMEREEKSRKRERQFSPSVERVVSGQAPAEP